MKINIGSQNGIFVLKMTCEIWKNWFVIFVLRILIKLYVWYNDRYMKEYNSGIKKIYTRYSVELIWMRFKRFREYEFCVRRVEWMSTPCVC